MDARNCTNYILKNLPLPPHHLAATLLCLWVALWVSLSSQRPLSRLPSPWLLDTSQGLQLRPLHRQFLVREARPELPSHCLFHLQSTLACPSWLLQPQCNMMLP